MRICFLLCAFFILTSCSHYLNMKIRTTADSNNGGNPVVLKIYQLRTDAKFNRVTLEKFWESDKSDIDALEPDLIDTPIEMVLYPEENKFLNEIEINDETIYLGVAANFYDPDIDQWRLLYDLSKGNVEDILIAVGRNKVAIAKKED